MILTFIAFAVLAAGLYMYIKGYKPCNVMLMDCGIVAAVAAVISLAGFASAKKKH